MDYIMKTRQEIKAEAKSRFAENRGMCVGVYALTALFTAALGGVGMGIGAVILLPVIEIATCGFFTALYRGEKRTVGDWFSTMFDRFGRKLGGYWWMGLWSFLWSLLFIVPGIIKGLAYSMTPYILAECPNVSAKNALKLSMRMTDGYKADLFVTALSFLGWQLLSALTFGILEIFFVGPYKSMTYGGIYHELKRSAIENGVVRWEEFEGL